MSFNFGAKFPKIIIGLAFAVLVGGYFLFFYLPCERVADDLVICQSYFQKLFQQKSPDHRPGENVDPGSPVDTSTWKTYHNEKFGFRLQYPGNLSLAEKLYTSKPPFFSLRGQGPELNFTLWINDPGRGFENFSVFVSEEDFTISGIKTHLDILEESVEYFLEDKVHRAAEVSFTYRSNNYFFIFTWRKQGQDQIEVVRKILKSFEFKG